MEEEMDISLQTLDETVFDQLMGDAPPSSKTITADTLPSSKKEEVKKDEKETPNVDAKVEHIEEKEEDLEEIIDSKEKEEDVSSENIFEQHYKGLVERGLWSEVDFPEDFEWNDDTYGQLVELQAEWKANEKYNSKLEKTGDYGKIIFDHIENGGNPDEIIDIFKESRRIDTIDISTDEGKESLIKEYYTKYAGWSKAKTDKFYKSLVDSSKEELDAEITEVKSLIDKEIQDQLKEVQESQKENLARQKAAEAAWTKNISEAITSRTDLSDEEKKQINNSLLVYNQKLPDGRLVNKFTIEFMKLQRDPKEYIDLVLFVENKEKYMNKVEKKVVTDVSKKTWNFVKGNNTLKKSPGAGFEKQDNSKSVDLKIDYKKFMQ